MNNLVDLLPNIQKREDEDLKRFVDFLFFTGIKKATILDKPDKTQRGSRARKFDYLIQINDGEKIALEFTQIFEREEEIIKLTQWSNIVSAFREELKSYLSKYKRFKWSGIWDVETPENFGATCKRARAIARNNLDNLLRAIERGESSVKINGFVLKLRKVIEQPNGGLFFSRPREVSIDPASEIMPILRKILPVKNKQLKIDQVRKVLVIVNKYVFADTSQIVLALSRIGDIWNYENFDKIFFEESPGNFVLVFSKELRNAWNSKPFLVNNPFIGPFQLWVTHLRRIDPCKTFKIVREIFEKHPEKPHKIFPDNLAREEIVQLGDWLIEQKRFDDAIWLIDKFLDDPDPEDPENYRGDPLFNYHERIVKGGDPYIITTVLGRLAWVIKKLAIHQKYIIKALSYTKKLSSHKNFYVKLQAIIPLIEIAKRRQWLDGYGRRPYQGAYKEFHELVFNLVKLIMNNPNCKAIAKRLCCVFEFYTDLSSKEAEQVLEALKITDKSACLFIYYAIFRQRHYKDQPIKFDGKKLDKKLKKMIRSKNKSYQRLRASIAWSLWEILNKNRNEFDTIKPYVDLILNQPYQRDLYCHIESIIRDWIKDRPNVCISWYKSMLSQISLFIRKQPQAQTSAWLMSTEEIIQAIAEYDHNELLKVMEKLVDLWKKGVFIGNPKNLFETYKLVSEEKQRAKVKAKFQSWYDSMKS